MNECVKRIIADSDDMMNGYYVFNNVWDMEPYTLRIKNKKISWNILNDGDDEWAYMYTRMDYLYKFIISYESTKDKQYLLFGFKIIKKWFKDHNIYITKNIGKIVHYLHKDLAHRPLDISIMCSNALDYINYLNKHHIISSTTYNNYLKKINKTINYISSYADGDNMSFSNWGIIENANILYCLYEMNKENKYIENRLIRMVYNQIKNNGSQIESSPFYLVQIILVLFKIYKCNKCRIKDKLKEVLIKSSDYLINISNIDNTIPNLGDSDIVNISEIMYIAYILLKDDKYLNYINKDISQEYLYKYGLKHINNKYINSNKNIIIEYNDQFVYKNYKKKDYILLSNINRVRDGHKHYDYMSIIWNDILVDLGRYSYKDDDLRNFYIGPRAHNTIYIDNDKYYQYFTSFVTSQLINCYDNEYNHGDNYLCVKMTSSIGYNNNISRYIIYVYDIGLFVTDIVDKEDKDNIITLFNIGNEYYIKDNRIINKNDKDKCIYYSNDLNKKYKQNKVYYSKQYNDKIETTQLECIYNNKCITHCFTNNSIPIKIEYKNNTIKYIIGNTNIIINIKKVNDC